MGILASLPRRGRHALRAGSVSALLVLVALIGTACTVMPKLPDTSPNKPPVADSKLSGTLRIGGAGSCITMLHLLEEDFRAVQPGLKLEFLPGARSGGGIEGVSAGDLDVGAVSRRPEPDEAKYGLKYLGLADDALAIVAHRDVKVSSVTTQQVRDMYSGKLTNWKQLGGPNMPLVVLARNEDDASMIAFRKHVLGPKLKLFPEATRLFYERDLVEGLLSTPGAVGFLSYGCVQSQCMSVQIMALNGVKPSVSSEINGTYKMIREFGVVAKPRPTKQVAALLDYLTSRRAAAILADNGYAPSNTRRQVSNR